MTYFPPRTLERSTTILGALHRSRDGLTIHQLGAETGMDHTTLHKELNDMMWRKQVQREPIHENEHQFHWSANRKSGQYRYRFTEEFGKLVMDLG